jgi:hypothetical protein
VYRRKHDAALCCETRAKVTHKCAVVHSTPLRTTRRSGGTAGAAGAAGTAPPLFVSAVNGGERSSSRPDHCTAVKVKLTLE